MSADNRQKNIAIPEDAIEGAAGVEEKIQIVGYEMGIDNKEQTKIPTKENTKTLVANPNQRQVEAIDFLQEGMSIPVRDGGIAIVKKRQSRDGETR